MARVDETVASLVWWEVSLPMEGLELHHLYGPLQPKPSHDTQIHLTVFNDMTQISEWQF